jgi:hypothetical protein
MQNLITTAVERQNCRGAEWDVFKLSGRQPMKVLLISANTELINMPVLPLGMSLVARAAEDAGNDVRQINLMAKHNALDGLVNSIKDYDPDVIGISVRNIDDQVSAGTRFLLEPVKAHKSTIISYWLQSVIHGDKSNYPTISEFVRYHLVMPTVPRRAYECKIWSVVIIIAPRWFFGPLISTESLERSKLFGC